MESRRVVHLQVTLDRAVGPSERVPELRLAFHSEQYEK
jgi:hypothetical protein